MINCHYLRIFCYLAKNLSFILAARDLFTTQPPFTKQVKALEDHLGMKLFNKNGQKVIFTIEKLHGQWCDNQIGWRGPHGRKIGLREVCNDAQHFAV
jgi:hypothetical protein